jgi:hypothetical protein
VAAVIRVLAGLLLIAHGLVHLIFLAGDIPEFTLEDSWALPEDAERTVGLGLMASAIGGFTLAGLAVLGVPGLASIWPALTIIAAGISLVLLLAFWNTQMIYGVATDLALIVVAVLQPGWTDRLG